MEAVAHRPGNPALTSFEWARAHPLAQRFTRQYPASTPVLVLVGAMVLWFYVFAVPVVWRQDRFATFDHDLGIWDQYVWLLAHGKVNALITVRGLTPFGFHASPAMLLFVPFYWLGAGPNFLDLTMIGFLCLGAMPVFRAARHHLGNEWQALVLAIAFLVNFAGQWMLQETFHPEVMAITPLLFAYLAAIEGRWRAFALWIYFALLWKEDVALAVLMLGFVLAVRGTRTVTRRVGPAATRKAGLYAMLAAVVWFLVMFRLVIPHFSPAGAFTDNLFGDLGASPTDLVRTSITNPHLVQEHLALSNPFDYIRQLTASFGFVAFLSPLLLLVGLPQTAINLLGSYNFFWTTRDHYAAIPLLAATLASTEGPARFKKPGIRRFLLGAVAVGAFFTCISWGISPLSADFRNGFWPLEQTPQQQQLAAAVAIPGPDDVVSSTYFLVPHLTHRDQAYTFPNPWIPINWGVHDENRPDPNQVDWIIVNPSTLNEMDKGALVSALTEPGHLLVAGEQPKPPFPVDIATVADPALWTVVANRPDLLIVHRVRA